MSSKSPLHRLIGTWDFEASREGQFLGRGSTTFEWIEDAKFVLQRAHDVPDPRARQDWTEHSPMPVTAVFGFDDTIDEQAMLYADARGVFRVYRMRVTDETWTLWRDAPGFFQRFVGTFRDAGTTIDGRWDASSDGIEWGRDFDMVYRKDTNGESDD